MEAICKEPLNAEAIIHAVSSNSAFSPAACHGNQVAASKWLAGWEPQMFFTGSGNQPPQEGAAIILC